MPLVFLAKENVRTLTLGVYRYMNKLPRKLASGICGSDGGDGDDCGVLPVLEPDHRRADGRRHERVRNITNERMKKIMIQYVPKELYMFSLEGERFLVEPDNCGVYDIDDMTEKLLSAKEPLTKEMALEDLQAEDPADAEELFNGLVELGLLRDVEAPEAPKAVFPGFPTNPMSLILNVAEACNMKCTYCFADHGEYNTGNKMMTREVAEKAVDFLASKTKESFLYVYFFGGEPLLNRDVVLHTVQYTKAKAAELGKSVMFGITTNGTILDDELLECFDENKFALLVSLDGPKKMNDKLRPMADGSGSTDTIVRNLHRLAERENIHLGCRATTTEEQSNLTDIMEFYDKFPLKFCHIEPASLSSQDVKDNVEYDERNFLAFIKEYGDVVKFMWQKIKKREPVPYHPFLREVQKLMKRTMQIYHCNMGGGSLTISAEGDIYACQRLVGESEHILGSVLDPDILSKFKPYIPLSSDEKDDCRTCWARYICAGDCPAEVMLNCGNDRPVLTPRCDLRRERLKWSIWLYSKMKSELSQEQIEEVFSMAFTSDEQNEDLAEQEGGYETVLI